MSHISEEQQVLEQIRDLLRAQMTSLSSVQLERTSRVTNVSVKAYATDVHEALGWPSSSTNGLLAKFDA